MRLPKYQAIGEASSPEELVSKLNVARRHGIAAALVHKLRRRFRLTDRATQQVCRTAVMTVDQAEVENTQLLNYGSSLEWR